MSQPEPSLESLAETIGQLSKTITSYLSLNGFAQPSFAIDAPPSYPPAPEVQGPRLMLIQALTDMLHLAYGSNDFLFQHTSLFVRPPCVSMEHNESAGRYLTTYTSSLLTMSQMFTSSIGSVSSPPYLSKAQPAIQKLLRPLSSPSRSSGVSYVMR